MLRKLLFAVASALLTAGVALMLTSRSQMSAWQLTAVAVVASAAGAAGGAYGAWRGRGVIRRGERQPAMAWGGAVVALAGFAILPLVWVRYPPAVIAGYLLVLATSATFVPIGLMGRGAHELPD